MKSPFRCLLAAARYAAASVMTVLILIVMVKAVKVLLQPVSLSLSVAQGSLFVVRRVDKPEALKFQFTLKVVVPRSGAHTYFRNITAYLFDKDTSALSSTPSYDSVFFFYVDDIMVPPRQQVGSVETAHSPWLGRNSELIGLSFFDLMYNRPHNDIISDLTMRLDGDVSQVTSTSTYNRTSTYICWPLVVGLDLHPVTSVVLEDVFCREEQGKHLI